MAPAIASVTFLEIEDVREVSVKATGPQGDRPARRPARMCRPVSASISWAVIRSRPPTRLTLSSTT